MEAQSSRIFTNSLAWLSSKVRNFIGKNQQQSQAIIMPHQACQKATSNLCRKSKQQLKQTILMKLRKPSSQNTLNRRLQKIKEFMEYKNMYQKPLQLVCPICIDMFIRPVVTVCGHTFCYRCLDEALLFNPVCPVCRTFIRGYDLTICKSINQIILRYLQKFDDESYCQTYAQKLNEFQFWKSNRTISPLKIKINDMIDARDTEFIWCKSVVKQVYKKNSKVTGYLIHYIGWNQVYDQIIEIDSQRLATLDFYSSRLDIPHYHLNQEVDDNMYSYVVIGEQPLQPLPNYNERVPNFDQYNQVGVSDQIIEDQSFDIPFVGNQRNEQNEEAPNYNDHLPLQCIMLNSNEEEQFQNNDQDISFKDSQEQAYYCAEYWGKPRQKQNPQEHKMNFLSEFLKVYKHQKEQSENIQIKNQAFSDTISFICTDKAPNSIQKLIQENIQSKRYIGQPQSYNFQMQNENLSMKAELECLLIAKPREIKVQIQQEKQSKKIDEEHQFAIKQYELDSNDNNQQLSYE